MGTVVSVGMNAKLIKIAEYLILEALRRAGKKWLSGLQIRKSVEETCSVDRDPAAFHRAIRRLETQGLLRSKSGPVATTSVEPRRLYLRTSKGRKQCHKDRAMLRRLLGNGTETTYVLGGATSHERNEGDDLSEITKAIAARQTQITQLQSEIETLQCAAGIMGGETAPAKATRQPTATPKPKAKRRPMTAAQRAAVGKRMKASWAKRKKASAAAAGASAQPTATRKRPRKPWSAAAKRAMSKRLKASWAKRRKAQG